MTEHSLPPAPLPHRPWWKRWWGITYLVLLGVTAMASAVLLAMPARLWESGAYSGMAKGLTLMFVLGFLDALLSIPIAVWAFHGRRWRLYSAPAGDLLLGLILFILSMAAVISFFFFACLAAS
jgi:hypothetical protein